MKHKIYALYKGETLLADGTAKEIAEKMGITVRSVRYYGTPTYQRRAKGDRTKDIAVLELRQYETYQALHELSDRLRRKNIRV